MLATQFKLQWLATTVLATTISGTALGQTPAEQPRESAKPQRDISQIGVADIVVTAEKRSETSQRTPISIIALSAQSLKTERIANLVDIQSSVPGLSVSQFVSSPQTLQLYIRGQGIYDNQITFDPAVSVNFNGVYVGRSAGLAFEIPGVERIEVLRGPQGTLYGRNATGGAVNIITVKPSLTDVSGEASISYGNYQAVKLTGAIDAPVVKDVLGVRLAGLISRRDGWVKNSGPGGDFAKVNVAGLRADVRWKPTDRLTLDYGFDLSLDNGTGPLIQNIGGSPIVQNGVVFGAPNYAGRVKSVDFGVILPNNDVQSHGHTLVGNWEAGAGLTVRSVTAWRSARAIVYEAATGGSTPAAPFGTPVTAFPTGALKAGLPGSFVLAAQRQDDQQNQFTQEINLLGDLFEDRLKYVVGAFYFNEHGSSRLNGILSPDGITNTIPLPRNSPLIPAQFRDNLPGTVILTGLSNRFGTIRNKSYAAFAQFTYTPAIWGDRLHLTAGGRYTEDRRQASCACLLTTTPPATPLSGSAKATFRSFKPTITVAADVTPDLNLYVKYAESYRSGGFNLRAIGNNDLTYNTVNGPVTVNGFTTPFQPENIRSYEVGLKGAFFNRRLRTSIVLYDSTVDNAQISNIAPNRAPTRGLISSIRNVTNAGKMRARGIEADAQVAITRDLRLGVNYTYFDGKYVDTVDSLGRDISKVLVVPYSPKNSVNVSGDYSLETGSIGRLNFHIGYSWVADQAVLPDRTQYPYSVIPSHSLMNASLSLKRIPRIEGLEVTVWSRNLMDRKYLASLLPGPTFTLPVVGQLVGNQLGYFAEPRTYGVELRYRF